MFLNCDIGHTNIFDMSKSILEVLTWSRSTERIDDGHLVFHLKDAVEDVYLLFTKSKGLVRCKSKVEFDKIRQVTEDDVFKEFYCEYIYKFTVHFKIKLTPLLYINNNIKIKRQLPIMISHFCLLVLHWHYGEEEEMSRSIQRYVVVNNSWQRAHHFEVLMLALTKSPAVWQKSKWLGTFYW